MRRVAWGALVLLVAALAPALAQDEEGDFILLRAAERVRYDAERRVIEASGEVVFAYDEVEVAADRLAADLRAERAVLSGNVTLRTQGETFRGEALLVRLDTREWEFTEARAAVSPDYFEGGVLSPLYVRARQVAGFEDLLAVRDGGVTTCDRPQPHYQVTARSLRIWPGRKLIAYDATIWALGARLFSVPWFVVPLREPQRQPFVPLVGESQLEGRYVKTLVNYAISDDSYGAGHLDYMTLRGFGKGVDHTQVHSRGRSRLYLYHLDDTTRGAEQWIATANHSQDLGGGLSLRAQADVRDNSYYYDAGSRITNSQVTLARQRGAANSALGFDYSRTAGAFDFTRMSASLRHHDRGPRYGLSLDSRYDVHSTFTGQADDHEFNNRLVVTERRPRMDLRLVVSKRFDPDGDRFTGDDFYRAVDHLPELALETDTYRLRAAPLGLPARLTLSVGNFAESPTNLDAYRVRMAYDGLPRTLPLGAAARLNLQGRFAQYLYGDRDRTAQYAYGGSTRVECDLGGPWQARLGYLMLEQKGFTPFAFDFVGVYRSAAMDVTYRRTERHRAQIRTGYDVRSSRWQDVTALLELPLQRNLQLGLSGGYDPNRGQARQLLARLRFRDQRAAFDLAARYQPQQGKFQRVTGALDWVVNPKWRVQLLSSWDGLQNDFVHGEVLVTRDLHCWEATAYYSLQRNLFQVDLRIKAFAWGRPDFRVGRFGQYLDTSLAEWY